MNGYDDNSVFNDWVRKTKANQPPDYFDTNPDLNMPPATAGLPNIGGAASPTDSTSSPTSNSIAALLQNMMRPRTPDEERRGKLSKLSQILAATATGLNKGDWGGLQKYGREQEEEAGGFGAGTERNLRMGDLLEKMQGHEEKFKEWAQKEKDRQDELIRKKFVESTKGELIRMDTQHPEYQDKYNNLAAAATPKEIKDLGLKLPWMSAADKSQTKEQLINTMNFDPDPNKRKQAKTVFEQLEASDIKVAGAKAYTGTEQRLKAEEAAANVPLENVSPAIRTIAEKISRYEIPLPSGFALRSPYWQKVMAVASQINPTFDASQYPVKLAVRKDFTSGTSSKTITSLNTAIGHLESLAKSGEALKNRSNQWWNAIANEALEIMGDPRVDKFNTDATAVAGELATVFKNTSGTDQEIKAWRQGLSAMKSPEQIKEGAVDEPIRLLSSRLENLKYKYEQGMGQPLDMQILSPKSQRILKKLGMADEVLKEYSGGGRKEAVAGGGTANAPPANLLKEGMNTTFKNGQTWTLQNGKQVQVQ